ncbi:MAG: bifunctional hydroxymethylpyrimidine kinase/phosphomethylpyrimidine kinase [Bryobacteraceae bacterium]
MPAAHVALTIAGSDPSGGAGIQADLKTFHQFGVYGEAVITLLTVQNTIRASRVECLDPELVLEQLWAVLEDIPPAAAKTGALGSPAIVRAVARAAAQFSFPLVVDPVMISKHGSPLLPEEARIALVSDLIPHATLITPNLHEAAALTGIGVSTPASMREAALRLRQMGARAVLVKGGHLEGSALDILLAGDTFYDFPAAHIDTRHTHGTGCTYSAAITAELARGLDLAGAVTNAKAFITEAIRTNPGLGHGSGPVNHWARPATPPGKAASSRKSDSRIDPAR